MPLYYKPPNIWSTLLEKEVWHRKYWTPRKIMKEKLPCTVNCISENLGSSLSEHTLCIIQSNIALVQCCSSTALTYFNSKKLGMATKLLVYLNKISSFHDSVPLCLVPVCFIVLEPTSIINIRLVFWFSLTFDAWQYLICFSF